MGNAVIGTLDLSTVAYITDASGLLGNAPIGGDLVEMDFQPGAQWEAGEPQAYSFDLPLLLKGSTESAILANFRTLQALADGTERTITRTFTAGSAVSESATCVVASVTAAWDFGMRGRFNAVLIIQVTSGAWA
jgi:hypothetical protein